MTKILRQTKKLLAEFDELITLRRNPSIAVIANIIDNIKSIFLFVESFLEKIVFGLLVFLSGAESFSLYIPGKTTS